MKKYIKEDNKFYTEDDVKTIQKEQGQTKYSVCELYSDMFTSDNEKNIDFKENMPLEAGIIWLGSYKINSNIVEKKVCPVCGQETVVPYHLVASALSGNNLFKSCCLSCKTKMAYSDHKQYSKIKQYILENQSKLQSTNRTGVVVKNV